MTVRNAEGVVKLDDVSFTANAGEILGIAGIAGSGQKELLEAITGLQTLESGDVIFHNPKKDKPVTFFHKSMRRVRELAKQGAFADERACAFAAAAGATWLHAAASDSIIGAEPPGDPSIVNTAQAVASLRVRLERA